jgi:DNA-binding transcriptional MerR regulator
VADYRISEVAERTGFSAATLRYYEDIGLVAPAARSKAGYRRYDDGAVGRLRFIARAKRLGLSLEEITGLAELFDLEECAPVHERLRSLLVTKQGDVTERIAELESFRDELARVSDRLGVPAPVGPCDDACACFTDDDPAESAIVMVDRKQDGIADVPMACTLEPGEVNSRVEAWTTLAARSVESVGTTDGVELRFGPDVAPAEVAALAASEQQCCSFLRFELRLTSDGTTLEIVAPADAREVVRALLSRS